jgi:hypothetical protein
LHTSTFDEESLQKKCGFFHTINHGSWHKCEVNFVVLFIIMYNMWYLLWQIYLTLKLQFDIKSSHILEKCQINVKLQF